MDNSNTISKNTGFSISHSDDFDKVLDNFVDKYMDHFKIRNGKFDVELQIVKLMAGIMFDHQVNERGKTITKDTAAIDFETANTHRTSISSVGIVIVRCYKDRWLTSDVGSRDGFSESNYYYSE